MKFAASIAFTLVLSCSGFAADAAAPDNRPKQDAKGNPIRYAKTGHASNYDEAKVGEYKLPDPLVLQNGKPVRDAQTWTTQRRPEIVKLYENEIYGRVPATAPKAKFEVIESGTAVLEGTAQRKHIVMRFGDGADAPKANLIVYTPAKTSGRVPVLLHLVFFNGLPSANPPTPPPAKDGGTAKTPRFSETGPVVDIIARGYGYATLRYTEIEGDRADTNVTGVRKLALRPGQEKPALGSPGTELEFAL